MEVGDFPNGTPFEHRSFGEELPLCQRYFYRTPDGGSSGTSTDFQQLGNGYVHSASTFISLVVFPIVMRTAPTCSFAGEVQFLDSSGNRDPGSNINMSNPTSRSVQPQLITSGAVVGHGGALRLVSDSDGYIQADAEL